MSDSPAPLAVPKRKRTSGGIIALVIVIVLVAAVGGWLSWEGRSRTAVAEPWPTVQITVTWPGASTETMDDTVAPPLENAVAGMAGMGHMLTRSRYGETVVTLYLHPGTDVDSAFHQTLSAVEAAQPQLPHGIDEPHITRFDGHVEPVLWLALFSPDGRYEDYYLSNYATHSFEPQVARIPGVRSVEVTGATDQSIRPCFDPDHLAAHQLTIADVSRSLKEQHINLNDHAWQQAALQRLNTIDQLGDIILKVEDGTPVFLRDVARIELSFSRECFSLLDGKPVIALALRPGPGVTAKALRELLLREHDNLASSLPVGLEYGVAIDLSRTVLDSPTRFNKNRPRAFSNPNAEMVVMEVQLPDSANIERTQAVVSRIDQILRQIPSVKHVLANAGEAGSNRARVFVQLGASGQTYAAICSRIRQSMADQLAEANVYLSDPSGATLPPMQRQALTLLVQGPSPQERGRLADGLLHKLRAEAWFIDGNVDFRSNVPHLEVAPDRERMAALGISQDQLNDEIAEFMGQSNTIGRKGVKGPIRLREGLGSHFADDLLKLPLKHAQGKMVPLSEVVKIVASSSASHLERYNREPATWVRATVALGSDMVEVRQRCRAIVAEQLPKPSAGDEYRVLLWSEDPGASPEALVGR